MLAVVETLGLVLQVVLVFLASTVAFDLVHVLLHRMAASRWAALRALGDLHGVHHRFLGEDLRIHEEFRRANLFCHVIPEYLTQVAFTLGLLALFPVRVVSGALALETLVFALILRGRGNDVNHRNIAVLPAYRPIFFCVPEYHALHHVRPEAHFSSWVKLLDHALGSGAGFRGRRAALDGDGPLAEALRCGLEARGAEVRALVAGADVGAVLAASDVLVLAGGRHDPARRFAALHRDGKLPVEVWLLADEGAPRLHAPGRHVQVCHVALPPGVRNDAARAERAAARALAGIGRGFHRVAARGGFGGVRAYLQLRFGGAAVAAQEAA